MKRLAIGAGLLLLVMIAVAVISLYLHDRATYRWYHKPARQISARPTDTITVVMVLGTVHRTTKEYNADSIVSVLNYFQPDIILTEEDTALFNNYHHQYLKTLRPSLFARLGRSFGFGHEEEIEGRAVRKYKILTPSVVAAPFDFEGRNEFYRVQNTFARESEIGNRLGLLLSKHLLSPEQELVLKNYFRLNDSVNSLSLKAPHFLNSDIFLALSARRQDALYRKLLWIVNTHDSLNAYRDFYRTNAEFWDTRNMTMANHIKDIIRLYPHKRIIVLTGAMHQYYLRNELFPLQDSLHFRMERY